EGLKNAFLDNLFYVQGKSPSIATRSDYCQTIAITLRDRVLHRWIATSETYHRQGSRTLAYISAEYIPGRHLGHTALNLGLYEEVRRAITELGLDFDELQRSEPEPGLGAAAYGHVA